MRLPLPPRYIVLLTLLCIVGGIVIRANIFSSTMWPIPSLPAYSGPYTVGTFDIEVPSADLLPAAADSKLVPETVSCRIFYPAEKDKSHISRPVYWIQEPQKGIVAAYGQFLGARPALASAFTYLSSIMYYIKIPAIRNAKLLQPPTSNGRWPAMIFSHGLGGTRNTYSQICGLLASYGIVVYSMDHRDGSSPIQYIRATEKTPERIAGYRSISHQQSPEVYAERDEQIKIRLSEVSLMHELLLRADRGETIQNLDPNHSRHKLFHPTKGESPENDLISMFAGKLDVHTPGKISFAGHSFGGATMIQFTKSVWYAQTKSSLLLLPPTKDLKAQVNYNSPVFLLDPWGMPLQSDETAALRHEPMPSFDSEAPASDASPVLAILSSAFFNWKGNLNQIKGALANPDARGTSLNKHAPAHIFYPRDSAHLSQSDFGVLFPNITKYIAKAAEPERTLRLNARAILEVMRRQGIQVANTTNADLELTGDEGEDEKAKGDWKILSTQEGSVRAWVSISADEVSGQRQSAEVKHDEEKISAAVQGDSLGNDELAGAR